MLSTATGILHESWNILLESAPYVLFGFFAAGVLKAFTAEKAIARHLGGKNISSVLKASLLGIPLPLCSCGVIPAAVGLRKQGASKGASAAFLVSVPETGVDSVAVTWALLDPIMTVLRPISAFITATVTGLLINRVPDDEPRVSAADQSGCGCTSSCAPPPQPSPPHLLRRVRDGLRYAFGDLLKDIGKWLFLGIVVAGIISYVLPPDFLTRFAENELLSLLIMLAVGIPLYICASASTPVAAALVLKGLSPGAALVFLLAGPATNAATLTVLGSLWGRRVTAVYLASIATCSLVLGWLTNRLYSWSGADVTRWMADLGEEAPSPWAIAAAVILLILFLRTCLRRRKAGGDVPSGGT